MPAATNTTFDSRHSWSRTWGSAARPPGAVDRQEVHVLAELAPLTRSKNPFQVRNRPYTSAGPGEGPERQVQVGEQADHEGADLPAAGRAGAPRSRAGHRHSTNRMTIGTTLIGEAVVRDAQPGEQRADDQVAVRRSSRQTRARWRSSATSSRWSVFISEKVASSQSVPVKARARRRAARDHGSDAEPDGDQDGDPDGRGGRGRRQEVGPPGDRLDRDQAEHLAEQRVERIAGRVEDAEARQQQLGFGPVAEADAGQQRPDVDDRGDANETKAARLPAFRPARSRVERAAHPGACRRRRDVQLGSPRGSRWGRAARRLAQDARTPAAGAAPGRLGV